MYVYLSYLNTATFVGVSDTPSGCRSDKDYTLLLALEVPSHMVDKISSRWKRESRGVQSRLTKGFKLADEYMLRVHVSKSPIGILSEVLECACVNGKLQVPSSFWENL
tara:strand:- start:996 stop:1319 length:324 start_codon:yes stop_codon:yes gene_type:complete